MGRGINKRLNNFYFQVSGRRSVYDELWHKKMTFL